ncbi:MAG: hypothetical protein IT324_34200 [Anaerolineae bacterium]|nr:hypothetical protein [Anaerolineae bacterium]
MPTIFEALGIEPQPIRIKIYDVRSKTEHVFTDGDAALNFLRRADGKYASADVRVFWADGEDDTDFTPSGPAAWDWATVWVGQFATRAAFEAEMNRRRAEEQVRGELARQRWLALSQDERDAITLAEYRDKGWIPGYAVFLDHGWFDNAAEKQALLDEVRTYYHDFELYCQANGLDPVAKLTAWEQQEAHYWDTPPAA